MTTLFEKPIMHVSDPYWDYHEVIKYIEQKYNIQTDNYVPKGGFTAKQLADDLADFPYCEKRKPYLNFWHWLTDNTEIHNGSNFYLSYDEGYSYTPAWVNEILKMIFDEFEPTYAEMHMHVSW